MANPFKQINKVLRQNSGRVDDVAEEVVKKVAPAGGGTKAVPTPGDRLHGPQQNVVQGPQQFHEVASPNINMMPHSSFATEGLGERAKAMGGTMMGNLEASVAADGKSILGAAGSHALRGAVFGGAAGGTMEAAQGGDFWAGAKSGAFNGAMGWSAYRMGMRATGANSLNPFKGMKGGKNQGIMASGRNMFNTYSPDANMSGQARAMLNNATRATMARQVTTQKRG